MSWTIRNGAPNELYHYGIKGMKWGVRKEYERSSKKTAKQHANTTKKIEKKGKVDYKKIKEKLDYLGGDGGWQAIFDEYDDRDPRLGKAYAAVVRLNTMIGNAKGDYPNFSRFMEDVSKGSSSDDKQLDRLLKKYADANGNNFDIANAHSRIKELMLKSTSRSGLTDKEWAELSELTEECQSLMSYYNQNYADLPTEEDKAIDAAEKQLATVLSDYNITLREGQSVNIEVVNGTAYFKYRDDSGKEGYTTSIDTLLSVVRADSKRLKDFRNRKSSTRTREKDVNSNAKPVTVKKGEKIETSQKERFEKQANSPQGRKTTDELLEMRKNSGKYGLDAIKRNKTMIEANINRRNQNFTKKQMVAKAPKKTVGQVTKSTIDSGAKAVKKYATDVVSSFKNKEDGRNFIEKLLNVQKTSWKNK